jgi:cell division protein FtsW (lipid II flippase)
VLVVRLVGLLAAIGLSVCVLLWLATGERKWLQRGWGLFKAALFVVVLILLLMFGERLLVV